jgi:hypothetical protein
MTAVTETPRPPVVSERSDTDCCPDSLSDLVAEEWFRNGLGIGREHLPGAVDHILVPREPCLTGWAEAPSKNGLRTTVFMRYTHLLDPRLLFRANRIQMTPAFFQI